ncbi:MAG: hypothetical protein LW690_16045 [Opitutaceae bacterium]|nr:hypothetical protein [Opitutaceae bacterium]
MKTAMIAAATLAATSAASATMTEWSVVSTAVTSGGISLVRYEVFATFNGPTDTLLNVFNFGAVPAGGGSEDWYGGFWHKDNSDYNGGVLSQQYGTWAPQLTGSITLNRPFDSFLLIGGNPGGTNTTNADPSWNSGGTGSHTGNASGWSRADLVNNGQLGWFNSSPPNLQGRVGTAPNTATQVKIGQFMLSSGHEARTYTLTAGYNNGAGGGVQFFTGQFTLVPAPGAIALLGLAGLAGRRRR